MNAPSTADLDEMRPLTSGLRFPEGGAADRDGSLVVPEIEGAALVRVRPDGTKETIAEVGGGANGCAFGPDGAIYVSNNGGYIFQEADGLPFPVGTPDGTVKGLVQRVDPRSRRRPRRCRRGGSGSAPPCAGWRPPPGRRIRPRSPRRRPRRSPARAPRGGSDQGSSAYQASSPVVRRYWAVPSGRIRMSRSARYRSRSASKSAGCQCSVPGVCC